MHSWITVVLIVIRNATSSYTILEFESILSHTTLGSLLHCCHSIVTPSMAATVSSLRSNHAMYHMPHLNNSWFQRQ
jgi:hypothetical protein